MMVKYIQRLISVLKWELATVWLLVFIIILLGETDVIPNGLVQPHSAAEFKLNTVAVVLVVIGIPSAIRLFTLNTTRGLRRMNNEEALRSYHIWSIVRMGILGLTAVFSVVVYYLATSVSGILCALIALVATLFCWPSCGKVSSYLDSINDE